MTAWLGIKTNTDIDRHLKGFFAHFALVIVISALLLTFLVMFPINLLKTSNSQYIKIQLQPSEVFTLWKHSKYRVKQSLIIREKKENSMAE